MCSTYISACTLQESPPHVLEADALDLQKYNLAPVMISSPNLALANGQCI